MAQMNSPDGKDASPATPGSGVGGAVTPDMAQLVTEMIALRDAMTKLGEVFREIQFEMDLIKRTEAIEHCNNLLQDVQKRLQ